MKIIVTGGYGFIGVNLINKLLLNKSYHILNIDYLNYVSSKNFKFHRFNNYSMYKFSKFDL
jgi:dTDP-D-glucose 4,6-dehydratase